MGLAVMLPIQSDARLADLGALLVFRHWLRGLLQEMAGPDHADLASAEAEPEEAAEHFGRLFF